MDEPTSFRLLLDRLRAGDDAAAAELFQRFGSRLVGLARSHLDSWMRRKEDPEDVVQSVYRSFFARFDARQFDVTTWNELWSLLTVLTVRKCADRVDYFRAQRRDVACERAGSLDEVLDREPTPEEAAVLTETIEEVLRGFDPDDRAVIELSLQGYTVVEISERLTRAERSVRRLRERVKKQLLRMHREAV